MPHKGKQRFKNKATAVISTTIKKKRNKLVSALRRESLIIKNLSFKATEEDLRGYLNKFGDICKINFLKKSGGKLVGRGIVQFSEEQSAAKAIQSCDGNDFLGRKIVVDWAVPRSENENNAVKLLKVKKKPEHSSAKTEEPDPEEEEKKSRNINTRNKFQVSSTGKAQDGKNKSKKIKNAKKGRLIVRNLPFKVTEAILLKHFGKYGEITEVTLLRKANGKLVGCGFIQFVKKNSATKAFLNCSGKPLLGRTIIVDWAVPKSKFNTSESSNKEEIEIKENPDDDKDGVKKSTSDSDDCDVQPIEIKEESLSDDSEEEGDGSDNKSDSNESSDSSDEEDEREESDDDSKQNTNIKKPKVVSNDVSEGRTVFIKNIPFSANNDALKTCMEQFGQVIYALICMDPVTEHSKGTAFVKFQTKESAEECLSAGTELTLCDQTLDVCRALSKDQLQDQANSKNGTQKSKDSRHLYLVKEGVILAGSRSAEGVSMADMAKRLQIEQWKSQMLRNLNMFVSLYRVVIHNLPSSWDDSKLRKLFLQHAGPKAVIREARVMRDMKNVDAQGIGKSKEFGFVSFTTHEHALQALRNINNNPNIFTSAKRPVVTFSIENKAIMNIKQKRMEKSRANNPLYTSHHDVKPGNKKITSSRNDKDLGQQRTNNGSAVEEDTEKFTGVTAKPGNKKLRTRFGLKAQAELHKQSVAKAKSKQKMKHRFDQNKRNTKEKRKDPQPKKGVKRKLDEDDLVFNKLVSNYKEKLMAAPTKKWYDE